VQITLTSEITVEEVQVMGSDAMLAHAAMVSTKGSRATSPLLNPILTDAKVEGLLNYLIERRHGTPFEHSSLTVRVHAPIKVFREWHRHRVGWSYNEESGRYKQLDPVFYIPPRDRLMIRPAGFRSSRPVFDVATDDEYEHTLLCLERGYKASYEEYERMLAGQVDRGLARDVLGVGIYSSMYATANPRSLMHFLELRTKKEGARRPSDPLHEIRVAADKLEVIFATHWPMTHGLWNRHGRQAP
jgi:thymidylate synthase (FAD)